MNKNPLLTIDVLSPSDAFDFRFGGFDISLLSSTYLILCLSISEISQIEIYSQ